MQIPVGARDEEREELLQRGDGGAGDSSNFAMAAEAGTNMSSGESMSFSKKMEFFKVDINNQSIWRPCIYINDWK